MICITNLTSIAVVEGENGARAGYLKPREVAAVPLRGQAPARRLSVHPFSEAICRRGGSCQFALCHRGAASRTAASPVSVPAIPSLRG